MSDILGYRYDVVVRNRVGNLVVVLATKNPLNFDLEWATEIEQDLLEHSHLDPIPFVIIASQDVGYVWKDASLSHGTEPPAAQISIADVLARYDREPSGRRMSGRELSLLLQTWLHDLTYGLVGNEQDPEKTLDMLGFLQAVDGGLVLGDIAA